MTFEEKLKEALGETAEERAVQMCAVEKKHRFSLAYRLWERRTLKSLRKKNGKFRRYTLRGSRLVIIALIAAASVLMGVTAYAVSLFGRFSFETQPDHSKMFIETTSSDKTTIEEYYGLPEEDGWEIIDLFSDNEWLSVAYKCGDKLIAFDQEVIDDDYMSIINTENAVIEPTSVYEENDGFFITFNTGDCGLFWIYDGYSFDLIGNMDKNELVNLAHSIKIIDLK